MQTIIPNCGRGLVVPNWFDKENMEDLWGHSITDEQFADLCRTIPDNLCDAVSALVRDAAEEILGG